MVIADSDADADSDSDADADAAADADARETAAATRIGRVTLTRASSSFHHVSRGEDARVRPRLDARDDDDDDDDDLARVRAFARSTRRWTDDATRPSSLVVTHRADRITFVSTKTTRR